MQLKSLLCSSVLIIAICLGNIQSHAQVKAATWISGDSVVDVSGIYGTKGIPNASNKPGARFMASFEADATGNLWLFGGNFEVYPLYNDLWKYNIANKVWTWVGGDNTFSQPPSYGTKGVASVNNKPGARESMVSWVDAQGNFWTFGGNNNTNGVSGGYLNDLWKFNVTTNQWIWMSGDSILNKHSVYGTKGTASSANKPGSRYGAASWKDAAGNFWLFGGNGYAGAAGGGYLNDLWKYNVSSNQWTWLSGDTIPYKAGVYGTKGTSSPTNMPGGRYLATAQTDANGNVYLFGGFGVFANNAQKRMNDLWVYSTSANEWTWLNGDNIFNSGNVSIYGTKGVAAPTNIPGYRSDLGSWIDAAGKLVIFGGLGRDASGDADELNDVWNYNKATNEWKWISGDSLIDNAGIYGIKGTPAVSNKPGSREGMSFCKDAQGIVWLFGGYGYDVYNEVDYLNDLWSYQGAGASLTYTFTGNGNWNISANWINSLVPASPVPTGSQIIINPQHGGECILNVPVTISNGASLSVAPGAVFRVLGNLTINQ